MIERKEGNNEWTLRDFLQFRNFNVNIIGIDVTLRENKSSDLIVKKT